MPQLKYKKHPALKEKLSRMGFSSTGHLATVLLDAFIEREGILPSRVYYKSVLEVQGQKYRDWVAGLVKRDVLKQIPAESTAETKAEFIRFMAGPAIAKYVNDEKALRFEVSTRSEHLNLQVEVGSLRGRIESLESAVASKDVELVQAKAKLAELGEVVAIQDTRIDKLEENQATMYAAMQVVYDVNELGTIDPPHFRKLAQASRKRHLRPVSASS